MENAIKALLISAGVLITILIISLGIYVYSISNGADQARCYCIIIRGASTK